MKQETADKIVCQLKNQQEKDRNFIYSLVDEQEYVRGRGVGVKEDEPSIELLHLRDIKQITIQLQKFQDSRYSALLSAIAVGRRTDEEISLRMWEKYCSLSDRPVSFPDWLKE